MSHGGVCRLTFPQRREPPGAPLKLYPAMVSGLEAQLEENVLPGELGPGDWRHVRGRLCGQVVCGGGGGGGGGDDNRDLGDHFAMPACPCVDAGVWI